MWGVGSPSLLRCECLALRTSGSCITEWPPPLWIYPGI
jgi:hypothetical protein